MKTKLGTSYLIGILLLMISGANFTKQDELKNGNKTEKSTEDDKTLQFILNLENSLRDIVKYVYKLSLPYTVRIAQEIKLSPSCMKSGIRLLRDFMQMKSLPLKMLDSFGKPFPGILKGTLWFRGDYDECLNIESLENRRKTDIIRGKYCSVYIKLNAVFKNPQGKYNNITLIKLLSEFMKPIKMSQFGNLLENLHFDWRYDICIPNTCSENDVENVINWAIKNVVPVGDMIPVGVERCHIKDDTIKFSIAQIICLTMFGIFVIWVSFSTVLDILLKNKIIPYINKKGKWLEDCITSSSIRQSSLYCLFSINLERNTKALGGIKFLLVCIIVYGHVISFRLIIMTFIEKPVHVLELFDDIYVEIAGQAIIMIETFFFISGFLTFYKRKQIETNSNMQYLIFLLRRYLRCSIPTYTVMAVVIILPILSNGPLWQSVIDEADYVEKYWWRYFLHIQNFFQTSYRFTEHLWFLDALFQLSVLTVPLLFIQHRWPRIGTVILNILILSSFVAHVADTWFKNYYIWIGVDFDIPKFLKNLFENYNMPYYSHLSSYCFGLLIGNIASNDKKMKFRKLIRAFLWIISVSLMALAIFGLHSYINDESPNEKIILLQKSLAPFAWTIGLAWLCVAFSKGDGGALNWFLSLNIFVILDRLTIWIYVVHPPIILYIYGQLRNTFPLTQTNLWMVYSFTMFLSLITSFLFYIFIQSPFIAFEKMFQSKSHNLKELKIADRKIEVYSVRL